VVVVTRDIPANARIGERRAERTLAVRRIPRRFAPADALASLGDALGARTAVPVSAGGYLTAGELQAEGAPAGGLLRPGERALELPARGAGDLAAGARVDVIVTSDRGIGRARLALEDVELLAWRPGAGPDREGSGVSALATLRVTVREALELTGATSSESELILLARPPGDGRV
jgi:Flp pilus assembly protein CpaB